MVTARYQPRSYPLGPTLAIWANDQRLEQIEELQPTVVCAIPWTRGGIDDWKANFSPRELRSGARAMPTTVDNPVVAAALRSLTHMVNLSTGLGHPSDRAAAVTLFRILLQASVTTRPRCAPSRSTTDGGRETRASSKRSLEESVRVDASAWSASAGPKTSWSSGGPKLTVDSAKPATKRGGRAGPRSRQSCSSSQKVARPCWDERRTTTGGACCRRRTGAVDRVDDRPRRRPLAAPRVQTGRRVRRRRTVRRARR